VLERPDVASRIARAVRRSRVTALLGPRQCGKTTLALAFAHERKAAFFDLESQPDQRRLQNPEFALRAERGLVVLDEIQTRPDLFPVLRILADRPRSGARFLVLGSASPDIVRGASETLAGRVEFVELGGFDLDEVGAGSWERLWLRGGFPRPWLARSNDDSVAWREGLVRTFLERDGFVIEQVLRAVTPTQAYFWASHGGAELDLFFIQEGKRWGVEVKFSEAPTPTRSMRTATHDLALDHLFVIYPGEHRYAVEERITMWPVQDIPDLKTHIGGRGRN